MTDSGVRCRSSGCRLSCSRSSEALAIDIDFVLALRTMYLLLASDGGSRERRNQLTHPAYTKPGLLAVAPNQVWPRDFTWLESLDTFSRFVVGWLVAPRESLTGSARFRAGAAGWPIVNRSDPARGS